MDEFIITQSSSSTYSIKGSKFFSIIEFSSSVDYIKSRLYEIKQMFPDASHICYAYRIKIADRLDEYCIDDGEPRGTAGKPILNVLKRKKLVNVSIFVIRYFGGTKLGIPGLIESYSQAANNVINIDSIVPLEKLCVLSFTYSYKFQKKIESILKEYSVNIINVDFNNNINMKIELLFIHEQEFKTKLIDSTKGSVFINNEIQ